MACVECGQAGATQRGVKCEMQWSSNEPPFRLTNRMKEGTGRLDFSGEVSHMAASWCKRKNGVCITQSSLTEQVHQTHQAGFLRLAQPSHTHNRWAHTLLPGRRSCWLRPTIIPPPAIPA